MRRFTLALLLAGYALLFLQLPSRGREPRAFDPLEPRGREVERAIEAGDFERALPIAQELDGAYPDDPVITYWLAEIHAASGRTTEADAAWQRYRAATGQTDDEGRP